MSMLQAPPPHMLLNTFYEFSVQLRLQYTLYLFAFVYKPESWLRAQQGCFANRVVIHDKSIVNRESREIKHQPSERMAKG
eukprot:1182284-Prorocentrum_minimum.AAC.2